MPKQLKEVRMGFRASIIALFVGVVLFVGLSLVYFSFDRVTSIIRSAASTFIDKVAEHAADRIDSQFKEVRDSVDILTSLPAIQEGRIDSPAIHALMAAMLRNNSQLFSLYVGYADGNFLEIDFIDRAGRAFRDRLAAPAEAAFRLLMSEPVKVRADARFVFRSVDRISPKGFAEKFELSLQPRGRGGFRARVLRRLGGNLPDAFRGGL